MKGRDVDWEIAGLQESGIPISAGGPSSCWEEEEWQPILSCLRGMPDLVPPPDLRAAVLAAVATVEPPRPLDCGAALDYLHLYLDGELEAAQRDQVEAHRAACGACDRAFAEMERYQEVCQSVPAVPPPADLRNAIYAEIRRARSGFWERLRAGWAPAPLLRWAALPVAALLLGWMLLLRSPSGPGPQPVPLGRTAPIATVWVPSELESGREAGQAVAPIKFSEVRPAEPLRPAVSGPRRALAGKLPSAHASSRLGGQKPSLRPEGGLKAEEAQPAAVGKESMMAFEVPWPSPLAPAEQVAAAAAGSDSEGAEPLESMEPLTLNYRRMFGAITQTGRGNGVQPEDLGSSTGPSLAASPPAGERTPSSEPKLPRAEVQGSVQKPARLPEGGSTDSPGSTEASDPTSGISPLPDLGMGE